MSNQILGNNGYKIQANTEDGLTLYRLTTFTNCRNGFVLATVLTSKSYKSEKAAIKAGHKDLAVRA